MANEEDFEEPEEESDPEPLNMKHFFFPLGLWTVGLLLATLLLVAEIIIKRLEKK